MGFWKSKKKRIAVIGLDGVSYDFVQEMIGMGELPHFRKLLGEGSTLRMRSTIPCVSSVAWASYMTGKNPGKHNIFGFVDRDPDSLEVFIPTSSDMGCQSLWEYLSEQEKRVLVINVPVTYPPKPVNGILIGCFLCTNIDKVAYPKDISRMLKEKGYRIDVDAWEARKSKETFLKNLHEALRKRVEIGLDLYAQEKWDFFQLHIMETDRINHFFWDAWVDKESPYREAFLQFYRDIDRAIGEIQRKVDPDSELILLSDHGFCLLKKEVNMNFWLKEKGWLKFDPMSTKAAKDIPSDSWAYSLIPGRIYLNPRKRKDTGKVESETFERDVMDSLPQLRDPESGERLIERVYRRDEIYQGPYLEKGPDYIAVPRPGFDLKGNYSSGHLVVPSEIKGMHTDDNAFLYVRGRHFQRDHAEIVDVFPTLLALMKLPQPEALDGTSLIR